VNVHTDK
jgi:hypothetical protein